MYEKSVNLNPKFYEACNNLGVLYFVKEKYNLARDWFLKCLGINENYPEALFNIADTFEVLGIEDQEKLYRQKLKEIAPNYK